MTLFGEPQCEMFARTCSTPSQLSFRHMGRFDNKYSGTIDGIIIKINSGPRTRRRGGRTLVALLLFWWLNQWIRMIILLTVPLHIPIIGDNSLMWSMLARGVVWLATCIRMTARNMLRPSQMPVAKKCSPRVQKKATFGVRCDRKIRWHFGLNLMAEARQPEVDQRSSHHKQEWLQHSRRWIQCTVEYL